MSLGLPIGLPALSAATKRRVTRDAWLLTAWWLVVGLACSAMLLEVVGIRSPMWRYPLTALVMYALGVVVAMRVWLALFSRAVRTAPGRYRGATDAERERDLRPKRWPAVAAAFASGPVIVVLVLELMGLFDLGRAILWALLVGLAIAAFIGWAFSRLPAGLGSEMLMAEMALQFVFGRSVGREPLPPLPHAASWPMIVRETWVQGLSFLVLSAAVGAAMVVALPGAVSLRDLLP
jgi:hypothetical protein